MTFLSARDSGERAIFNDIKNVTERRGARAGAAGGSELRMLRTSINSD